MTTILIRTFIIYLILITAMRLMGKRQIGELEVSDRVTTILISEIASLPLTNTSTPISHAIVPTVTLLTLEVISAFLIAKFPRVKNLLTARPSILIKKGRFCKKAMIDARISPDELIGELRQQGVTSPEEVLYAILEQNGKITVIPKVKYRPPTCEELGMELKEGGLYHIIIDRGYVNRHAIEEFKPFKKNIEDYILKEKLKLDDIFLMVINDVGEIRVIRKEETE